MRRSPMMLCDYFTITHKMFRGAWLPRPPETREERRRRYSHYSIPLTVCKRQFHLVAQNMLTRKMMNYIYHLAPAARWREWPAEQAYLPAEYAADGFIHCTAGDELMRSVA